MTRSAPKPLLFGHFETFKEPKFERKEFYEKMAPVSRTTTTPHDIINCKDCLRVRLAQIKCHSKDKAGLYGANDENDNQINIHHASK